MSIRGASRDNPVLVFLHGGPGATCTAFAAQTLRWEDHLTAFDARAVAPQFRIPVFVFQGAAGNMTPAQCARAFAGTVRAPITRFATIPRTGHLAAFTRPQEFLRLLVEHVLPVVPGTPGRHARSTPG